MYSMDFCKGEITMDQQSNTNQSNTNQSSGEEQHSEEQLQDNQLHDQSMSSDIHVLSTDTFQADTNSSNADVLNTENDISSLSMKIMDINPIIENLKQSIKEAIRTVYSKQSFVLNICTTREDSTLYTDLDFLVDELQDDEYKIQLEQTTDFSQVKENMFAKITELNNDNRVGGIYVDYLNSALSSYESIIYSMIHPTKDVGALNIVNTGLLLYEQQLVFTPITSAILKILDKHTLSGKCITIIDKSSRIGKPLAMALLHKGANVALLHDGIPEFKKICKATPIVIMTGSINPSCLKKDCLIIDIGNLSHSSSVIYKELNDIISQYVSPQDIYQLELLFILYNFLRIIFFNHKELFA